MARKVRQSCGVLMLLAASAVVLVTGPMADGAGKVAALKVTLSGVKPGGVIPGQFAFCIPARQGHTTFGPNKSPSIAWSKGPTGTASYAIIMVDPDVPSVFTDANKEGKIIPAALKRINFYHWILVDIAPAVTGLPVGADSDGVTPHGKPPGKTSYGVRGVNDYGSAFTSDPKMAGAYGGYDGSCPPWNDSIVHHYHFRVYALNVANLGVSGKFGGPEALKAMQTHILARGEVVGIYALNPAVSKRMGGK